MNILEYLPDPLQESSIPLEKLGVSEHAWTVDVVFEVIFALQGQNIAILGGDVLKFDRNGVPRFTYDNWYLQREPEWSWKEYVRLSCTHTEKYVIAYLKSNGETDFLFSLVVADEVVWRSLQA